MPLKRYMIKRYPLPYLFLYILTSTLHPLIFAPAYASTLGSTKIYYASGEKSQTDNTDERDLSGSFSFYRYGTSVRAEPSAKINYRVGFGEYKKSFSNQYEPLTNTTKSYYANFSIPIRDTKENSLRLTAYSSLHAKRYNDSGQLGYDQNNLTTALYFDSGSIYSVKASYGFKDYDYFSNPASNQFKNFLKFAPEISSVDGKVTISGFYKKDWVDNSENKEDYTEDILSIRSILKFNSPLLNKINCHAEHGRSDTKESLEDREDNLRFKYRLWDIKTYHKLGDSIDTNFMYGQKDRRYIGSSNSYDNWTISNNTKISVIKNGPFNLSLLLEAAHKETQFYQNDSLSYDKNSLKGGLNILERANWSFRPALGFTKYDYPPNSSSNQKSYKLDLNAKKYIGSTEKILEAGYWYKWKDYKNRSDTEQWAFNISFMLKF